MPIIQLLASGARPSGIEHVYSYSDQLDIGGTDKINVNIPQDAIEAGDLALFHIAYYDDTSPWTVGAPAVRILESNSGSGNSSGLFRVTLPGPNSFSLDANDNISKNRFRITKSVVRNAVVADADNTYSSTPPSLSGFNVGVDWSFLMFTYSSDFATSPMPALISQGYTQLWSNSNHQVYYKVADATTISPSGANSNQNGPKAHIRLSPAT